MWRITNLFFLLTFFRLNASAQSVGIGTTTPHASSILDINGISKGLLIPRMQSNQRTSIQSPAEGLLVYQLDTPSGFWYFRSGSWQLIHPEGVRGNDGIGINTSYVNGDSLYLLLNNGQLLNAGNVRGPMGIEGSAGIQGIQGLKGDSGVSIRNMIVTGDSLFITYNSGQTINAGYVRGANGYLESGNDAGNTTYWNGNRWVLNSNNIFNNGDAIGIHTNSPNASASLEIKDTARGILIPRMTMFQRNAIVNPAEGLMIYQTDENNGFWYFSNGAWLSLTNNHTQENIDVQIRRVITRQYLIQ
jgi:hypothetical protein